ncbi:MAG TPA: hypothetical protein VFS08_16380 [Gemmatimonadaceae bacterium]|nr:hypothetical protein [Gemmatimonadaceae bacterium]
MAPGTAATAPPRAAPGARPGRAIAVALAALLAPAAPAAAQGVLLELRPHVGDTVRVRLDQDVEVVATRKVDGRDSTVTMRRHLTVHSRSIVQQTDPGGATVLAVTDSMLVREDDGRSVRAGFGSAHARLRIAPDGTVRVLDDGGLMSPEASALVAQMPATLPGKAVVPGTTWSQAAPVPLPGQPDGPPAGRLSATFRLDSLGHYGDLAYVSMHGTLERPRGGVRLPKGARYESAGTVTGSFQLDRRRGWLIDVRATITMNSVVTQAQTGSEPVHVRTHVTQWLRAAPVDKR